MQELENKRIEEEVDTDYLAAIKELKENSVDRSKYDNLRSEHKKLLEMVVNGQTVPMEEVKPKYDIDKLRNDLYRNDDGLTNLDYITKTLQLREAIMENGGDDPFLPSGRKIAATQQDIEAAERVAQGLQEMVDYADGDPVVFTNEYQRRVRDTVPSKRK